MGLVADAKAFGRRFPAAVYLRKVSGENIRLFRNSRLWSQNDSAACYFNEASNDPNTSENRLKELAATHKTASARVLDASQLVAIYADADNSILKQLVEMERVHSLLKEGEVVQDHHLRNLRTYRLGLEGSNRHARALVLNKRGGPKVVSQIFCLDSDLPTMNGQIDRSVCLGNPDRIKNTEPVALTGKENVRFYWTVSANDDVKGAGGTTIKKLRTVVGDLIEITISPIREFTKAHGREALLSMSEVDLRNAWNSHLLDGCIVTDPDTGTKEAKVDPVMGFHVIGNGAYIGGRHINPGSEDDPFVMNYVYNRQMAGTYKNRARGKNPVYAVSSGIYQELAVPDETSRVYCVSDLKFVNRPDTPLAL